MTQAVASSFSLWERALQSLEKAGGVCLLGWRSLRTVFREGFEFGAFVDQVEAIGLRSLSVATLTAIFSSMVMTVQFAVQLARFGAKDYVGSVVSLSLARELGPVLTALMVGGRVGAGIAAELGSMNVTEQIDALRSMGADPVRQLVVPRVLAFVFVLPLLTSFSVALGTTGAMAMAWLAEDINPTYFLNAALRSVWVIDFAGGLLKALVFGLLISLIACYEGLTTEGGTAGVGRATTRAVVTCSIATLISDFGLTSLLMGLGW